MIRIWLNHFRRITRQLTQRLERRIPLDRAGLVIEHADDHGHDRLGARYELFASDACELADAFDAFGRDDSGGFGGFGGTDENSEDGGRVGFDEGGGGGDEEAEEFGGFLLLFPEGSATCVLKRSQTRPSSRIGRVLQLGNEVDERLS